MSSQVETSLTETNERFLDYARNDKKGIVYDWRPE